MAPSSVWLFRKAAASARSIDDIAKTALRLLTDRAHYQESVANMETVASQRLSFDVIARQLQQFFR